MKKYYLSWFTTTQSPTESAQYIELEAKSLKNATLKALIFWNKCRDEEIKPLSEIISVGYGGVWATLADETGLIKARLMSKNEKNFYWENVKSKW